LIFIPFVFSTDFHFLRRKFAGGKS